MSLKNRLNTKPILKAPGVYDALSALVAEKAGFEAAFISGSAVAFSQLARPDIGLVTATEMAQTVDRIKDRTSVWLFVDADSGFGNEYNVARTVRMFERAGADGIQIEDQLNTKSMSEVGKRPLVSPDTMCGKIKAATDARASSATVISARTDAAFTEGANAAIDRLGKYIEAGADMVFAEGLRTKDEATNLRNAIDARVPVLYNQLQPNAPGALDQDDLQDLGFNIVLFPSAVIAGALHGMIAGAESLSGTNKIELGSVSEFVT